jgi:glucuronoarabinoxylan endo-1,4-beta-xylanase
MQHFHCVPKVFSRAVLTLTLVAFASLGALSSGTASIATIDPTKTYQTIEGLGGATAFYAGWITAHPYKQEIYTNAFAGLNCSMLRLGDWYRYPTTLAGFDSAATEIVANGNRVLGHPVPVYMSSWSPPAFLKSNGQVANGGTLIKTNGVFAYTNFANYWYDSVQAYKSNGVNLTWISIQNEPDWVAGYDSCIFHPTEDTVNGTNYASYSKALDAVYQKLTNLPSPPKLLAPEPVHIAYNDLKNYAATMTANSFYGVAHHLYGDGGGTGDSFLGNLSSAASVFPSKPHFMTEYGDVQDMIECANLIHNELVVEQVSGYNHWSLVWPGKTGGLIQIENPFASQSTWTNAPPGTLTQSHGWWYSPSYWSMKHFSYFINPGYKRVSATDNDNNVRSSSFLSPDGLRLVVVLINTNASVSSAMSFNFGIFSVGKSSVYQTANTNYYFRSLGSLTNGQVLPPRSLTTVVLDQNVYVGPATNPSPASGASGVALSSALSWTPGSNALAHAVYLGVDSNAVAQATPASPQFLGMMTVTNFYPPLTGGATNYWRVDEIIGANTNVGAAWSFSTVPVPALAHRYSFSETGVTDVADSVSGPAWTGTLPNGGTLSGGQLSLSSNSQQYVSLPAGIVSTLTNFTIETWVKLNTTANWTRIFDFGNNTTTYMFLTPQNGSTSRLRFAITTSGTGGEQQINGPSALTAGGWYHVAVTRNGNTGILYLNDVAVGTNSAMTLKPSSLGSTANNYIGKSQWSDPYLNGVIDEFRIYNVALAPAEVAATFNLGPSQLLSTNSPTVAYSTSANNLTLSWPVSSAGFKVQFSTNLNQGNWLNLTSVPLQIVGGQWQVAVPLSGGTDSMFYRLVK